jgi:O-antigen/teichoic acid export membrane protein
VDADRRPTESVDDRVEASAVRDETDLNQRASAGVVIIATRGLVVVVIGFGGSVVIARLLTPEEVGVVAVGMAFVIFTGLISDGGLGAGLIRRGEPPTRRELQALSALQLSITTVIALVALVVALWAPLGRTGWVTAIMVASMPIVALQFPGRILLERSLLYHRLASVELVQVFCYHAWNIVTVVAGFGVWGLATGAIVRAATGTVLMAVVMPAGNVRPSFGLAAIKPLMGFGLRFQAVNATILVRDQTINLAVGAVAGVATLGQWSLARRIMDVPTLLIYSLERVSLSAIPQYLAAGRTPKRLVERAVALTVIAAGFVLTGLAGGAPGLVPGVFGEQWSAVSGAVTFSCLGLCLTGCVGVLQCYLYAVDDAGSVLRAGLVQVPVWFAVGLPLLPVLGLAAIGIGWAVGAAVETVVLAHQIRKKIPIRLLPVLAVPLVVGAVSAAGGWLLSVHLGRTLWSGMAGGALAAVVFGVGLALFQRASLVDAASLGVRSVRRASRTVLRRRASAPGGQRVGQ